MLRLELLNVKADLERELGPPAHANAGGNLPGSGSDASGSYQTDLGSS
jgi:hypothetical protein